MEIENIENIVKIIVKIIESHSRYINIIRKILLPLRYLRSKILFKKGLEKFDVWTFENKIFQKLFSLEDILITSSQTDIWKSDYLIGVIFFT